MTDHAPEYSHTPSQADDHSVQSNSDNTNAPAVDEPTISLSNHEQLIQEIIIQNIVKSADMACKAKRMNQLLSYVSGIDYSCGGESAYERNSSNQKLNNSNDNRQVSLPPNTN